MVKYFCESRRGELQNSSKIVAMMAHKSAELIFIRLSMREKLMTEEKELKTLKICFFDQLCTKYKLA